MKIRYKEENMHLIEQLITHKKNKSWQCKKAIYKMIQIVKLIIVFI